METRQFDNIHVRGIHAFRALFVAADGSIRAEPFPNPAKPPTAAHVTFTAEEWAQGRPVCAVAIREGSEGECRGCGIGTGCEGVQS